MVVTAKVPKRVRSAAPSTASRESPGKDEYLYLTGRPRLKTLIKFVKAHAVSPAPEATLTDLWHAAHRVVRRLETEEAGIADDPPRERLGPEYEPLLLEFFKDPLVRHGFNTVPTEVAIGSSGLSW